MTLLAVLVAGPKEYKGNGINHEGENFFGTLRVQTLLDGQGVLLHYEARLAGNEVVHSECTLLAPNMSGTLSLWPLMSELPGVLPHVAIREEERSATFSTGSRDARDEFREEIEIGIEGDGSLSYAHAWGMPGGNFEDRSRCTLRPSDA